jgi:hypothetical protein
MGSNDDARITAWRRKEAVLEASLKLLVLERPPSTNDIR